MLNLSAQPGRGRICRITFGLGHRASVMPPQLVPHVTDPEFYAEADAVRAVRKVDIVLPHTGRDYATGAILTVHTADAADALAAAFTRAAAMLRQEVPAAALDTIDATPEPIATPQPV